MRARKLTLRALSSAALGRCVFHLRMENQQTNPAVPLPTSQVAAWRAIARFFRSPLDAVSCAALPASCRLCRRPLLHLSKSPVCIECRHEMREQPHRGLCILCGEHLGWEDLRFSIHSESANRLLCDRCEHTPPPFQQAVAYGVYEGTLRGSIHLLKYERIAPIATPLGERLAAAIARIETLPASIIVVPVPLHTSKQRERGFNQTLLLARAAVRTLRRTHRQTRFDLAPGVLTRLRRTDSQSGLTRRQRQLNLRGAFSVRDSKRIAGASVLLLDDIYTTGATARECTKTLLDAGAQSVYVATLARSQREGVAFWNPIASAEIGTVNA